MATKPTNERETQCQFPADFAWVLAERILPENSNQAAATRGAMDVRVEHTDGRRDGHPLCQISKVVADDIMLFR